MWGRNDMISHICCLYFFPLHLGLRSVIRITQQWLPAWQARYLAVLKPDLSREASTAVSYPQGCHKCFARFLVRRSWQSLMQLRQISGTGFTTGLVKTHLSVSRTGVSGRVMFQYHGRYCIVNSRPVPLRFPRCCAGSIHRPLGCGELCCVEQL